MAKGQKYIWVMAKGQKHILRQLAFFQLALEKAGIVSDFQESRRGVPMILIDGPDGETQASVCYFGKTHVFRCFHPWKSGSQTRFTSPVIEDIVRYVQGVIS